MRTTHLLVAGGTRRIQKLTPSQVSMLLRFAVLRELEEEESTAKGKAATLAALRSYAGPGSVQELDRWWPFLRRLARQCLDQRRTQ